MPNQRIELTVLGESRILSSGRTSVALQLMRQALGAEECSEHVAEGVLHVW